MKFDIRRRESDKKWLIWGKHKGSSRSKSTTSWELIGTFNTIVGCENLMRRIIKGETVQETNPINLGPTKDISLDKQKYHSTTSLSERVEERVVS